MSRSIHLKEFRDIETVEAPEADYYDVTLDPGGYYFILKILWDLGKIAVIAYKETGPVTPADILKIFIGKRPCDLYIAICEEYGITSVHAAYLGKELKKAELALALGMKDYFQE